MATRLSLEEWRAVYIAMGVYRASVLQVSNNFMWRVYRLHSGL
jgi:hypothetical protein